ncbi:GTP pyrophosphokinase [Eubacterium uniforme]|uniref:GTP diphosphokinase n=2 Tax=Eubacterium uniforme TaxID=39495 RepID=A0A1T4V411_9FIRM|nr:GTP pyrophosphokinase [Eubacterium uniforme]
MDNENIMQNIIEHKEFSDSNDISSNLSPEQLYDNLIKIIKMYHPSDDISMIEKAYNVAKECHGEQKRKSGEPYIIHPLSTAIILAELELDKETIVAGLLHDVIEDTTMTKEEVTEIFGDDVAQLVDGVTKLTQLSYDTDKVEEQAENLRKMFLAMAKDIRVILIKLADRLHNMRTLQFMKPEKQKEKARETMDIYSPIANRLGISKIKTELDDLSLKYLEPDIYNTLTEDVSRRVEYKEDFINELMNEVRTYIEEAGIKAEINGRVKHYFSIYKKMITQDKTLDQIYDIFAVRIIVDNLRDCYAALGIIHEKYTPVPGRFKDYIAMPKPNMYQSLHTTLISKVGQPFEIQIRTHEMHRVAEYGIAAHWKYKENISGGGDNEEEKLSWLRQILEWQRDFEDNKEFMSLLKDNLNLFSEHVYCFTPNGDVKTLPAGSTPVDFAYMIHSAVGNRMIGARVNGRMVNVDYKLQNGDRIEIVTSQNSQGPSLDWLKIVKSPQAKSKINQWFKSVNKEDNFLRGKDLLEKYLKSKGYNPSDVLKPEYTDVCVRKYGYKEWDAIVAAIGHGGLKEGQVANRLLEEYEKIKAKDKVLSDQDIIDSINNSEAATKTKERVSKGGIVVEGIHDVAVRFSRCCSPVPGDEIIGFVTRGRGVSIHRTDCINILNLPDFERNRLIEATWQGQDIIKNEEYATEITVYANDRTGMLNSVTKVLAESDKNIISLNVRPNKQGIATINVSFNIKNVAELEKITGKIRMIDGVIDIERTTGM